MIIQNHGISEDLISATYHDAQEFFSLPEEQKMEVYLGKSKVRGTIPTVNLPGHS